MSRRIEIVVEFTDRAWADEMKPVEEEDGSTYTPTVEETVEYFVEYASGALISDGVSYRGRLCP